MDQVIEAMSSKFQFRFKDCDSAANILAESLTINIDKLLRFQKYYSRNR